MSDNTSTTSTSTIEAQISELAKLGRSYPEGHLMSISEFALNTLTVWLTINNTPAPVIELVQDIVMLERATAAAQGVPECDIVAASLVTEMPLALKRIDDVARLIQAHRRGRGRVKRAGQLATIGKR